MKKKRNLTIFEEVGNYPEDALKYYTPSIEEFYVGFEYGVFEDYDFLPKKDWHKVTFDGDPESLNFPSSDCSNTRVKYLDKEDIEELGWTIITTTEDEIIATKRNGYYRLIKDLSGLIIDNGLKWEANEQYFSGVIKNKSELKRLMKQLNIE